MRKVLAFLSKTLRKIEGQKTYFVIAQSVFFVLLIVNNSLTYCTSKQREKEIDIVQKMDSIRAKESQINYDLQLAYQSITQMRRRIDSVNIVVYSMSEKLSVCEHENVELSKKYVDLLKNYMITDEMLQNVMLERGFSMQEIIRIQNNIKKGIR